MFLPSVICRVGNEAQKSAFLTDSTFNGAFRCTCVTLGYVNRHGHHGVFMKTNVNDSCQGIKVGLTIAQLQRESSHDFT